MKKTLAILTLSLASLSLTACDINATGTINPDGATHIVIDTGPLDKAHLATCESYAHILAPTQNKDKDKDVQPVTVSVDKKKSSCHFETTTTNIVHTNDTNTTVTIDPVISLDKETLDKLFEKQDFTLTLTAPTTIKEAPGAEKVSGTSAIYTNPIVLTKPLTLTLQEAPPAPSNKFPLWGIILVVLAALVLVYEAFTRLKPLIVRVLEEKTSPSPTAHDDEPPTSTPFTNEGLPSSPFADTDMTSEDSSPYIPSANTTHREKDDRFSDDFWS